MTWQQVFKSTGFLILSSYCSIWRWLQVMLEMHQWEKCSEGTKNEDCSLLECHLLTTKLTTKYSGNFFCLNQNQMFHVFKSVVQTLMNPCRALDNDGIDWSIWEYFPLWYADFVVTTCAMLHPFVQSGLSLKMLRWEDLLWENAKTTQWW